MKKLLLPALVAIAFAGTGIHAMAEETVTEKAAEAGRDLKKNAKKAGRKIEDKTCEMVNGKMECAAKKVGNKVKNAADEVKDKADDVTH